MNTRVCQAIRIFLTQLEGIQGELSALMAEKRVVLTDINNDDITRLSEEERTLISRMQRLLGERRKILEFAQQHKLPSESLLHLAKVVAGDDRDVLIERIEQAQVIAAQLRHESWVHWIISHRSYNHYTELFDLIAHCGQQSPTYHDGENHSHSGGALLDASI